MKRLAALAAALLLGTAALADPMAPWIGSVSSSLALTSATTAYTAGQLIASSATAANIVVPFFTIPSGYQALFLPRVRLATNDATSTAWPAVAIQVDVWSVAPTFTNGDRAAFLPATGAANHLGAFSCVMSAEYGDGAYAECAPTVGNFAMPAVPGSKVYWTLQAVGASGVTGASKTFTLTPEFSF